VNIVKNEQQRRILAVDIGGGTQDILLYEGWKNPENFTKLILPSPTVIAGNRIAQATSRGKALYLSGTIMGGGKSTRGIKKHLESGLPVYAQKNAAQTINDDLDKVQAMGVVLVDEQPDLDCHHVEMKDLDLKSLRQALKLYDLELPTEVGVAVQDHGEAPPGVSNRLFRFKHWETFLKQGGALEKMVYTVPPSYMTRMLAVQQDVPQAVLMDTCSAAIWGALLDAQVKQELSRGVVVVNIGNQHTFAALIKEDRILGLFEHHTRLMGPEKLAHLVNKLRQGKLTHEEVFHDGGHGCSIAESIPAGFQFVSVTGPRRCLASDLNYHLVNPFGDMMLTGCYGLVKAIKG